MDLRFFISLTKALKESSDIQSILKFQHALTNKFKNKRLPNKHQQLFRGQLQKICEILKKHT